MRVKLMCIAAHETLSCLVLHVNNGTKFYVNLTSKFLLRGVRREGDAPFGRHKSVLRNCRTSIRDILSFTKLVNVKIAKLAGVLRFQ